MDSHLCIPTIDGNAHVVPEEVFTKIISGEMKITEMDDWEPVIRTALKEWLDNLKDPHAAGQWHEPPRYTVRLPDRWPCAGDVVRRPHRPRSLTLSAIASDHRAQCRAVSPVSLNGAHNANHQDCRRN